MGSKCISERCQKLSGSEEELAGINGELLLLACGDLPLLFGEVVAKQNDGDGDDLLEDWFKSKGGASRSNKLK